MQQEKKCPTKHDQTNGPQNIVRKQVSKWTQCFWKNVCLFVSALNKTWLTLVMFGKRDGEWEGASMIPLCIEESRFYNSEVNV